MIDYFVSKIIQEITTLKKTPTNVDVLITIALKTVKIIAITYFTIRADFSMINIFLYAKCIIVVYV